MAHHKCILCPVDFSECSKTALSHASVLAQRYGARLLVQHVLVPLNMPYYNYMLPGGPYQDFELEMQRHADDTLKGFLQTMPAGGVQFQPLLSVGAPVMEIVEAARREQVDLLIMGTHGRGGLERFLLGSVTEKVLRKAPCPVLVVRCGIAPGISLDTSKAGDPLRILVPVDLTEHSARTLGHAVTIAEEYQAKLYIVNILEQPTSPGIDPSYTGMLLDYWSEIQAETKRMLDELVRSSVEAKVAEEHWVAVGRPAEEIIQASLEKHTGLIVMGAKPAWLKGLGAVGTTARRVICHAACPILLLR